MVSLVGLAVYMELGGVLLLHGSHGLLGLRLLLLLLNPLLHLPHIGKQLGIGGLGSFLVT